MSYDYIMKIVFTIIGLILVGKAFGDIVEVDAMVWPTAASNTGLRTFSFATNIHILEDYTAFCPKFYTLLVFSANGFIGNYDMQKLETKIKYNDTLIDGYALGYDEVDGSTITLNKAIDFTPGKLNIQVSNLHIVETNYKQFYLAVLLLNSASDVILMKRVKVPFYFESGIWSDTNKSTVSLRFVSSIGYQSSAYMEFKIPSCVQLNDTGEFMTCDSIENFSLSTGFPSQPICKIENNKIIVHHINGTYPITNNTAITIDIALPSSHHCGNDDYAYSVVKESLKGNLLERVVYAGINRGEVYWAPNDSIKVTSYGLRVAPSVLLLVLIGVFL